MSDGPSTPESEAHKSTHGVQRDPNVKPTRRDVLSESAISALENTKVNRRTVLGAAAGTAGLGVLASLGLHNPNNSESTHPNAEMTPSPEKQLQNDIRFLKRNEDGDLTYSDVAQYYDVALRVEPTSADPRILIRHEHRTGKNVETQEITNAEMSQLTFGAIRVAGSNNERPQDSFPDPKAPDGFTYEWLLLVRRTGDPEKPYVYMDGHGNESDTPWFVSPNFASLNLDTMDFITPSQP